MKRTSEQYILMTMSFCGPVAILPIAIIRALDSQWLTVTIDFALIVSMLTLGLYVYITHKTKMPSIILSVMTLVGMVSVVHLNGHLYIYWAYPTFVASFYLLRPRVALILSFTAILALTPALIGKIDMTAYIAALISLIIIVVFAYIFSTRMLAQSHQLALLVKKDPLTGVGNRRALDDKLQEYIDGQSRTNINASLIMMDLDHFKKINDMYGHIVGDQVLIKFSAIVQERIRISDSLFRFGGEEFVIIALGTSAASALILAEDLRKLTENAILLPDKMTVSIGIAEYKKDETVDDWLHRGDSAMYEAKNLGRNRVCVAD